MPRPLKIFLIISSLLLAVVAMIGGGAWYWWSQHSAEFLEAAQSAVAEGLKSGAALDEGACVAMALERHRAEVNLGASVRNSLWLNGCLDASRPLQEFCTGVPLQSELVAAGVWGGTTCAQKGFSDPFCPTLMQSVSKYCSSEERTEKLKGLGKSGPISP